ncbi:hypothetical protein [Leisingera sp. ANG-Vp]|uniref:hypothetical protein n=1 Tax=Leisingera sp. ANG-Vp TaxID=1577896 RepID=UPI00057D9C4E|nr:hypothetical protein [Leisingera sp. ANG-Vp]KIC21979.1 hypothetical protein RA20_02405 [Leisingera sp. ANG-Vp]
MLSAVSSTASLYNSMKQMQAAYQRQPAVAEAGGQPVDAPLVDGSTQGLARSVTREQALSGVRPDSLTPQYIGPARAAARSEALNLKQVNGIDMAAYYLDLANGCQAGPKPVSVLAAEAGYAKARRITG